MVKEQKVKEDLLQRIREKYYSRPFGGKPDVLPFKL